MKSKISRLLFCLLWALFTDTVRGQQDCGTTVTEEDKQIYLKIRKEIQAMGYSAASRGVTDVPVTIHIIRTSAGNGGITIEEVLNEIKVVNSLYINSQIRFYQCGPVDYINDDNYYYFEKQTDETICDIRDVDNTINIYFTYDLVDSDGSGLCGYAYTSGSKDRVIMSNDCSTNGSTLPHEIGHYFSLMHTHYTGNGDELVDGSNCSVAGDLFCDTPADPKLSYSTVSSACIYTGTEKDANGDSYNPDVKNIMSYSTKECRNKFSLEQYDQMNYYLISYRNYLVCNSAPIADFSMNNKLTCSGEAITFEDNSAGLPSSWLWTFPNGTPSSSTLKNPEVVFPSTGTYNVTLKASNTFGSNTYTKPIQVNIGSNKSLPHIQGFESGNFAGLDTIINTESTILINSSAAKSGSYGIILAGNSSSGFSPPTPATAFSTNPSHLAVFSIPCIDLTGSNQVTLNFDYKLKFQYENYYTNFRVTVNDSAVTQVLQPSGASTSWTNISLDLSSWTGEKIKIAFESNCKYDYTQNGVFIDNINITGQQVAPTAGFSSNSTSVCKNTQVSFADGSLYQPTTWKWNFQGGTPSTSTLQNPVITYDTPGVYNVELIVSNNKGADTIVKTGFITVKACALSTINSDISNLVRIFPNPANDFLNIIPDNLSGIKYKLRICNTLGQCVLEDSFSGKRILDISAIQLGGFYFVEVWSEDGKQKMVKPLIIFK